MTDCKAALRALEYATENGLSPEDVKLIRGALTGQSWMPISSAPRDGTRILILLSECNKEQWVDIAKYGKEIPLGCSTNWQNGYGQGYSWRPTHWMHLPAPLENKEG